MAEGKKLYFAEWRVATPAFNSYEDIQYGQGELGTDFTDNCDGRWGLTLGPLINVVTCSTYDTGGITPTNALGAADSGTMNATVFLYVARGRGIAKITASTLALADPSVIIDLTEAASGPPVYSRSANGTQMISFPMDNTAYHNITTVANAGSADTASANNEGTICRILGFGGSKNQVGFYGGFGRSGAAGTAMNTIRENILSGVVTMDASAWSTVATVTDSLSPTSWAMDDDFWLPGTDRGPLFVEARFTEFRPLIGSISQNAANKVIQIDWYGMNVLICNATGTRYSTSLSGESVGPGLFPRNSSPVQGRCTGAAGLERWLIWNEYNVITGETYVLAARPRQSGDGHNQPLSFYTLATLTNTESRFCKDIGTLGGATSPRVLMGHDTAAAPGNVAWCKYGRVARWYDDTAYDFAASGTWYGTKLLRQPHWKKRIKYIEIDGLSDMTSTETITLQIDMVNPDTGVTSTQTCGAAISKNGTTRIWAKEGDPWLSVSFRPRLVFARGGTTTTSPKVAPEGILRIAYELEELAIDGRLPNEAPP